MARIPNSPSDIERANRPRCGARLASDPTATCNNMAGAATPHPGYGYCSKHGGNTEAGRKSGARAAGRDLIEKFKAADPQRFRFGGNRLDPSIATLTPEQALVEEVRRSAAMVRFLEDRIGHWGLSLGDATIETFVSRAPGVVRPLTDPRLKRGVDDFLRELPEENADSPNHLPELIQAHPDSGIASFTNKREWLYLYREERAHLARVSKMALDAGVAQRLVTLAEDQGRILSSSIRLILEALRLTPEQARQVPIIVPRVLRAVANDQPLPALEDLMGVIEPDPEPTSQPAIGSGPGSTVSGSVVPPR